jgi:hypothetical protein
MAFHHGRHAAVAPERPPERSKPARHRLAKVPKKARWVPAVIPAAIALVLASNPVQAPDAGALAKIKCKEVTGRAAVDPILHQDMAAPSAHGHTFFGNAFLLQMSNPNTADYADLVGKPTNCENPSDTAAYWMPTLHYMSGPNAGKPVPLMAYRAYYRSFDHKDSGQGQALPADVRLIAGDATATGPQSTKVSNWTCGQFSGIGPQSTIPDCTGQAGTPGRTLTAHVTFPSCWDGRLSPHNVSGDTRDNEHFAYAKRSVCPPGFPIKTVELRQTFTFDYQGSGRDIMLTSDHMVPGAKPGQTLHADFWNTWNQKGFEQMVAHCVTNGAHPTFSGECG